MFTGLIEATGQVQSWQEREGDVRARIAVPASFMADVGEGDSICVNGACLTALELADDSFAVDISRETLHCTTLAEAGEGLPVNLEKSLAVGQRLGGHFVTGHVDAVAEVLEIRPDARSQRWIFSLPPTLRGLVAPKGSIAVDGVSLTVNGVEDDRFDVNLIPHTIAVTGFARLDVGARVNLEADLLARYVAQQCGNSASAEEQVS